MITENSNMQRIAGTRTNRHLALYSHRQTGISLIPVMVTIFIFTLLTTQVIIPNQSRSLRQANIEATAASADKLVQAILTYRADPYNIDSWPGPTTDNVSINDLLVPKYLPIFNNRTPWNGSWEIVAPTDGSLGVILETNVGNIDIAKALVQKIGTSASIETTTVKISVPVPVAHYVQNLSVGWLTVANLEEKDIATNAITLPYTPSVTTETVDNLIVKNDLRVENDLTVKNNLTVENDLIVKKDLRVENALTVKNNLTVENDLIVKKDLRVENDLIVKKDLRVENALTVENNLTVKGTLTANNIIEMDLGGSSKNYKKNIQPLEIDASKIYQLQTVSYDYREQYKHYQKPSAGGRQLGLIAEQVNAVIPELAIRQGKQIVNVDYEKLGVLLLQAVQELKVDLLALQTENQSLKAQIDALQTDIEADG